MPLSEDEERILQDIERTFYEQDPKFARAVEKPPVQRHVSTKIAIAAFVVGLAVVIGTFTRVPVVAFGGFVLMMLSTGLFVSGLVREKQAGASKNRSALSATLADRLKDMRNKER